MFKNLGPEALAISGRQSELIELALSFGFRGLNLDLAEFLDQCKTHSVAHARRLLDSAKLQIGGFRLPVAWQADDATYRADLQSFSEQAALAAEAGFRRALTTIEPASDLHPFHQHFELCRQRLGEMAKLLEPHGIRIGVGFAAAPERRANKAFEFIHSLDALLLLLSTVAAKSVGAVVDLWDVHVSGGSLDAFKKLGGERLIAVRIADAPADATPAELTEADRMLPGEGGAIDASAALVTLAEMGFDGPVTPVPSPVQLKGLRREAAVKRVGETLDRAWKGAGLTAAGKLGAPVRP